MRLSFVRPHNSIDSEVAVDALADFVVMSGPNGSGKSNLLEAIANGSMAVDGAAAQQATDPAFRLFSLAQLVVTVEGEQTPAAMRDRWVQTHQQVAQQADQLRRQAAARRPIDSDDLDRAVQGELIRQRVLSQKAIDELVESAGKRLIDIDVDDFRRHAPVLPGLRDPFTMGIAEIFLSYHQHWVANRFQQFLEERGEFEGEPLSDEGFEAQHGPPPWDLLNDVLQQIGLPYQFDGPTGTEDTLPYVVRLVHDETRVEVTMEQLSSGEKTLLALALSLYTGERHGDAIELPKVLLLDEADASLHPSMVQSLLNVIERTFVSRFCVKVLLATHAPSTVALAPEASLYVMRRTETPRLVKASRDNALRALTVGIPTLSVSIDHRRQVFVESEYDADCYQEFFRLLRARLDTPFSLEFIPSGKGGQGNEEAVRHLVHSLRSSGNSSVHGIVDRDDRGGAPEGVVFNPHRDSLENLVLDPVVIGAFLLRERITSAEDMGLATERRHFEINEQDAQVIATWVTDAIATADDDQTPTAVRYAGGFSVDVPRFALDLDGHDLESRLVTQFPALNRYRNRLKVQVIRLALADAHHLIPDDVESLFLTVLHST